MKIATHYDNLQVARNASPEVIRAAYRGLTQRYHPDRNPDDPERYERIMKLINRAFEVLSDPRRRAAHDAWIAEQEAIALAESAVDTRMRGKTATSEFKPAQPNQTNNAAMSDAESNTAAAQILRASRVHREAAAQGSDGGYTGPLYNEYQPSRPRATADRIAAAREAYRAERRRRATSQEIATSQIHSDPREPHAPSATSAVAVQASTQSRGAPATPGTLGQVPIGVAANRSREAHNGGAGAPVAPPEELIGMAGGNANARAVKGSRWAAKTMQVFGIIALVKLFFAFKSNQFKGLVEAAMVLALGLVCAAVAFGLGWASGKETSHSREAP